MKIKTLITALGLAFAFGSTAMAQTSSTVGQFGDRNLNIVEQINTADAKSHITVYGWDGTTVVKQHRASGDVHGKADGLYANIQQNWGGLNEAGIVQTGYLQEAWILQGGGHLNKAHIGQSNGLYETGKKNLASITQDGHSNIASTIQHGYGHYSNTIQQGHGNVSYVTQTH